jgi:hypothetical protein
MALSGSSKAVDAGAGAESAGRGARAREVVWFGIAILWQRAPIEDRHHGRFSITLGDLRPNNTSKVQKMPHIENSSQLLHIVGD